MQAVNDWNKGIIDEFHANEGKVGGQFEGVPILLMTHKGAKSGTLRTNPLAYMKDGDRLLVFGSKGGAPKHPDWYRNVKANPDVTVEVGTDKFDATAAEVTGEERDRLYARNAANITAFADYEKRTTRKIPVIALTRKS